MISYMRFTSQFFLYKKITNPQSLVDWDIGVAQLFRSFAESYVYEQ